MWTVYDSTTGTTDIGSSSGISLVRNATAADTSQNYPLYINGVTYYCNKPFHGTIIQHGGGSKIDCDFTANEALVSGWGGYANNTSGFTIIVDRYN